MNAIEADRLVVKRGGRVVLDQLSCHLPAGRVTGLLGPSGAGKTTLIRAVVGVQKIAGGDLSVLGRPAGSADLRRRLGYMTQDAAIYDDLTVAENVRYFASVVGAPSERIAAAIAEVGLTSAAQQVGHTLSGGQRSRASLACALVAEPDLLVLDEPTVGQDPVLREELWNTLRSRATAGTTVVLSSHVMDEAARCDQLLLIRDGRILATGTPREITDRAGTPDMDAAFLTLIRRAATTPAGAQS